MKALHIALVECGRVRQTAATIAGHHAQQAASSKIEELITATVTLRFLYRAKSVCSVWVDVCLGFECGVLDYPAIVQPAYTPIY